MQEWKVLAKPTTVLSELCTWEVNHIMPDYSYLNWSVAALYLQTLAINKGRETASSQRFSYFGSLAEGNGGDGACAENSNKAVSFPLPTPFDHRGCGVNKELPSYPGWSAVQLSKSRALTERIRRGLTAAPLSRCQPNLHPFVAWSSCCVSLQVCLIYRCQNVFCIQTEYIKWLQPAIFPQCSIIRHTALHFREIKMPLTDAGAQRSVSVRKHHVLLTSVLH